MAVYIINFSTEDGTTHHEKITATRKDIRATSYHHNGAAKATLTPYRIGKRYKGLSGNEIEVFLPSSYRALHGLGGPSLYDAIFRECISVDDFSGLVGILIKYYKEPLKNEKT